MQVFSLTSIVTFGFWPFTQEMPETQGFQAKAHRNRYDNELAFVGKIVGVTSHGRAKTLNTLARSRVGTGLRDLQAHPLGSNPRGRSGGAGGKKAITSSIEPDPLFRGTSGHSARNFFRHSHPLET